MDTDEDEEKVRQFLLRQDMEMLERIRRREWTVPWVYGEGEQDPPFGYTVGLFAFDGHPELAIFGLGAGDTVGVLNEVGRRVRAGTRVVEGELITFDDWPHRLHALPLVNASDVLFAANRIFGRPDDAPVPGLQLVWDDKDGRFPWEPDYAPPRWLQPLPGTFRA